MRSLHWVVKTPDRTNLTEFLHGSLGMRALRHEEFDEGCLAACNGPYDNKWSKTMIGYGPEDENFVIEMTYNYLMKSYDYGNDLAYIKIKSRPAFKTITEKNLGTELDMNVIEVKSPEGFNFRIINEDPDSAVGAMCSICLNVTDIEKSTAFWVDTVGLLEIDAGDEPEPFVVLSCGVSSATLRLRQLPAGTLLKRGTGYGRIAFSVPTEDLEVIQDGMEAAKYSVLTPLATLETPGKADVKVIIVADPDGHEVCFVGDEGFRELSKVDEDAPKLLGEAINKDTSKEWFAKKGGADKAKK